MRRSDSDPFSTLVSVARAVSIYLYSHWNCPYWKRLASQYLQDVEVSSCADGLLTRGRAGSLTVSILGSPAKTQVVIGIPGPQGFTEMSLRREYRTHWKLQEIEIGSELFDKMFFICGPVRLVFALLDAETRNLLIQSSRELPQSLELIGGELVVETAMDLQVPRILPLLFKIGEWFAQPLDVERRLVQNATRDPEAGVRLKNLLLLAREFPEDPETREVLRAACSDPNPEVRLRAGRTLGAEGLPVLLKLTEDLEDDAVSAEAFSFLEREISFERTKYTLLRALDKSCPQTARACLEALGRGGDDSAANLLVEVIGSVRGDLRVAAVKALGRVGSTAAVLPLKELAERIPGDPELSQAVRQAIAQIQSRLPGASPGQLSLAGAEAGQLSLTQAEAGQLSIASDSSGQLSLSGDEE